MEDPLDHQKLVHSIARRYVGKGLELDDLKQIGNIGLLAAVRRHELEKGAAFSTYATAWIKKEICEALSNQARPVRIPRWVRGKISKGVSPDDPELGRSLRNSLRAGLRVLKAQRADEELFPLAAPEAVEPEHDFEVIAPRLAKLDPRDRLILSKRFGLDGEAPRSRSQIGESLRLTRERIRQIEVKALERLRETASDAVPKRDRLQLNSPGVSTLDQHLPLSQAI